MRALAKQQQEEQSTAFSVGSLFWGTAPAFSLTDEDEDEEDENDLLGGDELDLERKYLTMSWWLLNIGWKDVAERVRAAVEAVFQG